MTILISTDVIHAGGAETFVLRLSEALTQKGHTVILYVLYKNRIDHRLVKTIAPHVEVAPANLKAIRLLQLTDGFFFRFKMNLSLIGFFLSRDMRKYFVNRKVDIAHSHLFTTDQIAVTAAQGLNVPVVSTMHGDYSLFWEKVEQGAAIRVAKFKKRMPEVLNRLSAIVCISEEQLLFFRKLPTLSVEHKLAKIYNGYALARHMETKTRENLNIPHDHFIYGMVARGIPEKGWQEVITAFLQLPFKKTSLVLIGDSVYVQDLKKQYETEETIHFVGYSKNPVEYISLFDVALFGSTYGAESLPTVLMEYLACHVPVIATDIAECKAMLAVGNETAGVVLPLQDGNLRAEDMSQAMQRLQSDPEFYAQLKKNTSIAFRKFDMEYCVSQYIQLYKRTLSEN